MSRIAMGWSLLAMLLAAGCSRPSEPQPPEPTGAARFVVAMSQALSAADVARVDVTVDAFDVNPSTIPLVRDGQVWIGTMSSIRAGTNRRFYAEAFDSTDTKIFEGEVTGVTITADTTTVVQIMAQQVPPPPVFENQSPIITSLVVSQPSVEPGGTLTMTAAVHDPNPGDTLTYVWTASDGTLSDPSGLDITWTAPATAGDVTLTFTATDQLGALSAVSFTLRVEVVGRGNADITVSFNSWPVVNSVVATPNRIPVGQATTVTATVQDPDAEAGTLQYSWSASCTGTWANGDSAVARFTPTAQPGNAACNNCDLTVTVTDGRGGVNTGTLAICVDNDAVVSYPPQIASTYQSTRTVVEGNVTRLRINATDSRGRPLTFEWSANVGMLGQPSTNTEGTTGEVLWTAPSCLRSGVTPTVRVIMYAASTPNLRTEHEFTFVWGDTGRICSGAIGDLCFDADTDYLGRWTFDTTPSDMSIWSNHLVDFDGDPYIANAGAWVDAAYSQGDRFLGRRDADDAELDFGTQSFTVALWVNINTGRDQWLLSKASDYGLDGGWSLRSYYGTLYWYTQDGELHAAQSFSGNTWHHVAITRDATSGELRFYIDGQLDSTHASPNAITDTTAVLTVGARGNGASPLLGMMDELTLLQRAATPLELASLAAKSCR